MKSSGKSLVLTCCITFVDVLHFVHHYCILVKKNTMNFSLLRFEFEFIGIKCM